MSLPVSSSCQRIESYVCYSVCIYSCGKRNTHIYIYKYAFDWCIVHIENTLCNFSTEIVLFVSFKPQWLFFVIK